MLQAVITTDPNEGLLLHNKPARSFFDAIMKKFGECTIEERRSIVRSDDEFYEAMKQQIATTARFKVEEYFSELETLVFLK